MSSGVEGIALFWVPASFEISVSRKRRFDIPFQDVNKNVS
jgi:hypothetical protein